MNIVRWYRNLSITKQISLVIGTVVVGFAAVGVSYFQILLVQQSSTERLNQFSEFQDSVATLRSDLLFAQNAASDFQWTRRLEQLEVFELTMDAVADRAQAVSESEVLPEIDESVGSLVDSVIEYRTTVYEAAESQLAIGLDAESGLLGELRETALRFDELNSTHRGAMLETSFLQMLRHESSFILLGDPATAAEMSDEFESFNAALSAASLNRSVKEEYASLVGGYYELFEETVESIGLRDLSAERAQSLADRLVPVLNDMVSSSESALSDAQSGQQLQNTLITSVFIAVLAATFIATGGLLLLLARRVSASLGTLRRTVSEVGEGNLEARTGMVSGDELGLLGAAFDQMLDERQDHDLGQARTENERLNDSVIAILEGVSELAEKNLTVRIKVREDVTGPVADALNQMADETARILTSISQIAQDVANASRLTSDQGALVGKVAAAERNIVRETVKKLQDASGTMIEISELAKQCNSVAGLATESTQAAAESVSRNSENMQDIRGTISETEKRIKRLGERSQEINAVVDIINSIAERTHVLALNASMQAAAAGDAGRGFAVVADEVQRLAESSRESTSQIGSLVKNIQVETSETMAAMNKAISQVVDGSKKAEDAGEQMQQTRLHTDQLAAAVNEIAQSSTDQAKEGQALVHEAGKIEESTAQTSVALQEQTAQTERLLKSADELLESVGVFVLPGSKDESDNPIIVEGLPSDLETHPADLIAANS